MFLRRADYGLGRDAGVGRDLGVGAGRGVKAGVGEEVGVAVAVGVGVGVPPDCAQYLPPVFNKFGFRPAQTIIWLPVHTAV